MIDAFVGQVYVYTLTQGTNCFLWQESKLSLLMEYWLVPGADSGVILIL